MPTIHPAAEVSGDDLLRAVEQLGPAEFERFVARVLALRAGRAAPRLSAAEAGLLGRINAGLPDDLRRRHQALAARRDERTLSAEEHEELRRLTDEVEAREADRVAALAELAALRGVTLTALLAELGLPASD